MVGCIYVTQSINSVIASFGRNSPQIKAKSLLNNLGLKIFCANSDETTRYASDLIGKSLQQVTSTRVDKNKEVAHSYNQQLMDQIPAEAFSRLSTGGKANNYKVDCVMFKAGKQWKSGKNYLEASMDQLFV